MVGDPSAEQFNINIMKLSENRYIGSETILTRFLDFQNIFGLDLLNASTVNIEKDIPELPIKHHISEKKEFTGVFFRNGNFKTVYDNSDIFNLMEIAKKIPDYCDIHDQISKNNENTDRYSGSGVIIPDHNPMFYHKNYFASYQFPSEYFEIFSKLEIDPAKITSVILPSANLINISKFFKWIESKKSSIKLFTDHQEQIKLIKQLFSASTFIDNAFQGFQLNEKTGLSIKNYNNSINISVEFDSIAPSHHQLSIGFIKSAQKAKQVIKARHNIILITCSAFEETSLLLKSAGTPAVIIDDGSPNISRISPIDHIFLSSGINYEFQYHLHPETIHSSFNTWDTAAALSAGDIESVKNSIIELSESGELKKEINFFNILSMIRLYIHTTMNRQHSNDLRDIYNFNIQRLNPSIISEQKENVKIFLIYYNKSLFEFASFYELKSSTEIYYDRISSYLAFEPKKSSENIKPDSTMLYTDRMQNLAKKILSDRKRLNTLLDFYRENSTLETAKASDALGRAISIRKEIYSEEFYINNDEKTTKTYIPDNKSNQLTDKKKLKAKPSLFQKEQNKLKVLKTFTVAAVIISIIAFTVFSLFSKKSKIKPQNPISTKSEIGRVKKNTVNNDKEKISKNKLKKKYDIKISTMDIYNYANRIAEKNGYHKLSYSAMTNKNPHWIYPSNVFVMLDGEKITVKRGDTLWQLSSKKLNRMAYEFYNSIDRINNSKNTSDSDRNNFIRIAEQNAFSKEHLRIIRKIKKNVSTQP